MTNKSACTDVVEFLGVAEITVIDLCEKAAAIRTDDVRIRPLEQTAIAIIGKCPGNRVCNLEIERDSQVRIKVTLNAEFRAVGDSEIDFAKRHLLQQFRYFIVGILGLVLSNNRGGLLAANILALVAAIGFAERSWQTLATERGWIVELACPMDAGLPAWFDLDQWFPAVFGVQASCGRSPEMLFGVTMAEALMAMSVAAFIVTTLVLIASRLRR